MMEQATGLVTIALALVVLVATALPVLRHGAWWIRAFEFPRVQIAALAAGVLAFHLGVNGWQAPTDIALATMLAACLAVQIAHIVPYTPLYPKQVRAAGDEDHGDRTHTLDVVVANVLTPNRNADGLLQLIREHEPDIVLTVETDAWWESRLEALAPRYPHAVRQPLDNLYGMHLYSRLELVEPRIEFLVEQDVPSVHAQVVLRSGQRVSLHCLHPAPPSPVENPTSDERDAELLLVARAIDTPARAVVVMGDLNDVAWSSTTRLFQRMSGLLDPRVGRGMFSTFHAGHRLARWPLDHVFCSSDFTLVSLSRLAAFGSDHFPIRAVLRHSPEARVGHDSPRPEPGDHARAREKIEAVDADG